MKAQHFVYIILGVVLIVGLFLPVDKDVDVSEPTSDFFKSVESLPDNSRVLLATDFDANSRAEMVPQLQIVTEHLMEKNLRIIAISMWDQGPMFADRILKNTGKEMDKTYGVDYINLGYAAGVHSMVRLLKDDIKAVYKKDFLGNTVNDMEIMAGIEGATDIPLMVVISDRPSSPKTYIEQIQSFKKDYRIVCGLTATTVPPLTPYIQSGQIEGYIIGLKGASEYEFLMEEVGLGRRAMSSQSIGQIAIIIFVIAGNLFAIIRKGRE